MEVLGRLREAQGGPSKVLVIGPAVLGPSCGLPDCRLLEKL